MSIPTFTAATLVPAAVPTLYFIGVTTGRSSIQQIFPRWAEALGLADARLQGIDMPLHAAAQDYRTVVEFIKRDPLSLGALVTTHKIDLYDACADLFDVVDPLARLMGETSCLSKTTAGLVCHAKDPLSSGLALQSFVPEDHWATAGGEVLSMGAGGSTIAIAWHLTRPERASLPTRIIVTNRSQARLDHLADVYADFGSTVPLETVLAPRPEDNDDVLIDLAPQSLTINATGLGKDAPGSPLSSAAVFPERGLVWELNYRGELVFLDQARAQAPSRHLKVEDGWNYFLHGWTQVIAEVFHVDIPTGEGFDHLSELARTAR